MTVRTRSTRTRTKRSLESLLKRAARKGEARIKDRDGQVFVIRPERKTSSPLDVEGIELGVTSTEIVQFIHEGRKMFSEDDANR